VTALSAQVTIPTQPVPFTLQTLAVMLCGLSLGARRGALSQVAYLAGGAARLPVFAGFSAGPEHLFGPTGGYLWGFVLMAGLLGFAADRGADRRYGFCALALLGAITLQLFCGWAWLSTFVGFRAAFFSGVAPFALLEIAKGAVATFGFPPLRNRFIQS